MQRQAWWSYPPRPYAGGHLARMVTLVCGPPCSGKSTLVHQLAQPGDVVLDFDDVCRELGSRHQWAHSQAVRAQADVLMRVRIRELSTRPGVGGYVIRTAPLPDQRVALAHQLSTSTVWVLDPGYAECVRRARTRPRGTVAGIRWWYTRYQPSAVDVPCPWVPDVHTTTTDHVITSRAW